MKYFNEMIENYCRENGIDPIRLLENGRENRKQQSENPQEHQAIFKELDRFKYPRSQEPIELMKMYSHNELKTLLPKKFIADCNRTRMSWLREKEAELAENTPLTRKVRNFCFNPESLKH